MRHKFIALTLILALTAALAPALVPALAHEPGQGQKSPEEMLEQGTRDILRAFELFLLTIPQYSPPEILDNGDIIIRRIHPGDKHPAPEPENDKDQTKT